MKTSIKNAEIVYHRTRRLVDEFEQVIDDITISETVGLLRAVNQLKTKLENEMFRVLTNHLY